jgi:hypothetical protein
MKNKKTLYLFFILSAFLYLLNLWLSAGFNGGADSITHYQISKYSWQHDYLLIDQWGKPVFTILFSPIAQFGFQAMNLANIALIFWGAWLSYIIARNLNLQKAHWVPFIVLFTPIVAGNSVSGLTEPICAIFLILFLYFATKEQWILGSILVGFMPFARSEGFVILTLILVFFGMTRRWKYIPFLLIGTLIFNTIGYVITDKPLWILDNNPYINTDINVYGSGSFFHFFQLALPIFGIPFLFVLIQTITQFGYFKNILSSYKWSLQDQLWFWVITGSFWGYFLAHTVLWWQGMWASLGLIRVMFVIAVPMALMAVKGWEFLASKWPTLNNKIATSTFLFIVFLGPFVMRMCEFQEIQILAPLGVEEQVNKKLDLALRQKYDMKKHKTFTGHPYLTLLLDVDPYDIKINDRLREWKKAQPGDLVIWDGHYGPNEETVLQSELDSDTTFTLSMIVEPDAPFYTLNNLLYSIRVYEKK